MTHCTSPSVTHCTLSGACRLLLRGLLALSLTLWRYGLHSHPTKRRGSVKTPAVRRHHLHCIWWTLVLFKWPLNLNWRGSILTVCNVPLTWEFLGTASRESSWSETGPLFPLETAYEHLPHLKLKMTRTVINSNHHPPPGRRYDITHSPAAAVRSGADVLHRAPAGRLYIYSGDAQHTVRANHFHGSVTEVALHH